MDNLDICMSILKDYDFIDLFENITFTLHNLGTSGRQQWKKKHKKGEYNPRRKVWSITSFSQHAYRKNLLSDITIMSLIFTSYDHRWLCTYSICVRHLWRWMGLLRSERSWNKYIFHNYWILYLRTIPFKKSSAYSKW